ncbi:hypothetical protein [Deinococcus petrolearius]|uniref:Uncharacterized protein n=1 Tax=Deinococcus petrolearius TaxID=1751295 RepID=A0ABW1DHT5_9DEIO
MARSRFLLFLLLAAPLAAGAPLLVGCAPEVLRPIRSQALDTAGPVPDVVVVAVSGRCGPPCQAPYDNWDYLSARGTLDAVAGVLSAQGLRTQVAGYASGAPLSWTSRKAPGVQRGYAALLRDMAAMQAAWFGPERRAVGVRPPRLVLLGHSQGSVWLHHFVQTHPELPVALQIDLDGICIAWALDHGPELAATRLDRPGQPRAADACDLRRAAGRQVRGKDLVWDNVARDLEVQSKRLPSGLSAGGGLYVNYLFEVTPNLRPDGSSAGIERFVSAREDHSAVSYPGSDAVAWVLRRTAAIAAGWKTPDPAPSGPVARPPAAAPAP